MTDAAPPPHPKRRRLRRLVKVAVLSLLGLVVIVPTIGYLWLTSPWGASFLRRQAVERTNAVIAGRLELDAVSVSGLLRVDARGARLFAPGASRPVVSLDHVMVHVRLLQLIQRRIDVSAIEVEGPALRMANSDLASAIAPRSPPAPKSPTKTAAPAKLPHFAVSAPEIRIRDGSVRLAGLAIDDIGLEAAAHGVIDNAGIEASLDSFELSTRDSHLKLDGSGKLDGSQAEVRLLDLLVGAGDLRHIAPELRPIGDVRLAGCARLDRGRANATFQVTLPEGRIDLDAQGDLAAPDYAAVVDVDGVDPHRLAASLPPATVQTRIIAHGRGLPPDDRAVLRLDASGSRYRHLPVDRLLLAARVRGLQAEIEELTAAAAGVKVSGHGAVSARRASLQLTLDAPTLSETRHQLERGLGRPVPMLAGSLHVDASMDGPFLAPNATVHVTAPALEASGTRVDLLDLSADLNRVTPIPVGTFDISAARVIAGGHVGGGIQARGSIDGRQAHVAATGMYRANPVRLVFDATRDRRSGGEEHWALDTLHVQALGLELDSALRARVAFGHGRASVEGLRLDAGLLGYVAADASYDPRGQLRAAVDVTGLRVDALPHGLLPSDLALAGIVDARIEASGTARAPVADAVVSIEDGRVRSFRPFELKAGVHYEARRVEAAATLRSRGGTVEVTLDAPVVRSFSSPVDAVVSIDHLDLTRVGTLLTPPQDMRGLVEGTFRISGTLRDPRVTTRVLAQDFSGFGVDGVTASLDETYVQSRLNLRFDARRQATAGVAFVGSATVPAQPLVEGRRLDWLHIPMNAHLDLRRFNLAWLTRFPGVPRDLAGSIAGRISVDGQLAAPRVEGAIEAAHVNGAGYRDVKTLIDLRAVEDIRLHAEASFQGKPAFQLDASAGASPVKLAAMTPAQRYAVPFRVEGHLLPTSVRRLLPAAHYDGEAALELTAGGTADHPSLHFASRVNDLRLRTGRSAGNLVAGLDYADETTTLGISLHTSGQGLLDVHGSMSGSLGASVLAETPTAVLDYPIRGFSAEAQHLDVSLFEGTTETIEGLGGLFDMKVAPRGGVLTLRDAGEQLDANIALTNGRVTVVEFGTFTDITLKASASASDRRLVVSELSGKSGKGGFSLPQSTDGSAPIHFELSRLGVITGSLGVDLKNFPLVQAYQTRAIISLQIRTLATAGHEAPIVVSLRDRSITLDHLLLSHGHVEVPSAIPKSVESLEPNPDVVLVNRPHEVAPQGTGPAWTFAIDSIDVPEKLCGSSKRIDCGPLVVDAPLGNHLELSTNPSHAFQVRLDPKLAVNGGSPVKLEGFVQVDGTVSLIKSRFDLERLADGDKSHVDFTAQPIDDPKLDLQAHLETDQQLLDVTVTGTLKNPQKKFQGNPPFADDNEVYYFLATGQRQTQPQQNDPASVQTQLVNAGVSALGSAAFGVVRDRLLGFLPPAARLDVLEVNPDLTAAGGIANVRAGKRYLGGDLLITGQYNPNANPLLNQNTYEVRANYRINRAVSLQGLAGTSGHYEMNVIIHKDFCAPRQKREGLCAKHPPPRAAAP